MNRTYSYTPQTLSEKRKQRFFSSLPGVLSWGVMLGFITCSFLHPLWAILFLLAFELYWLLFLLYTLILYGCSEVSLRRERDTDRRLSAEKPTGRTDALTPDDIFHVVLITVSTESLENLTQRLDGLRQQDFNKERILIFFALADGAHPKVKTAVWDFHRAQNDPFSSVYISPFPIKDGEMYVAGANLNTAAHMARHVLERKEISEEHTLVSCLDPGSVWDPRHLSCLTCAFLQCDNRQQQGFRPAAVFPSNFWEVAGDSPMWNFGTALLMVFDRIYPYSLGSFSRQSLTFSSLRKIGYWPDDMLADDMALYWKATLHFKGDYQVVTLPVPNRLNLDHPESEASAPRKLFLRNAKWAAGMENFPILMRGLHRHSGISFFMRSWLAGKWLLHQVTCAVWAFLFFAFSWLPGLTIALGVSTPVAYYLAPRVFFHVGILSLLCFAATFILCFAALPRPAQHHSIFFWIRQVVSGTGLALLLPFFSCVPILNVQTRLLFRRIKGVP